MGGGVIYDDGSGEAIRRYRAEYHKQIAAARERLPDLQCEHKRVSDRIRANDARLRDISQRLDQVPRDLVELTDPAGKQALLQERRALLEEQEAIGLEQTGLRQKESRLYSDLVETQLTAHG